MKKSLTKVLPVVFTLLISIQLSSQNKQEISDRYIIIDNLDIFFIENGDSNSYDAEFELFNIFENESSKPAFVDVNEVNNVVKFYIKSSSNKYENQRTCNININKKDYLNTFYNALKHMKVQFILSEGQLIEIETYFLKFNN